MDFPCVDLCVASTARNTLQGVQAASSGTHTRWCGEQASSLALSRAPVCGSPKLPEGSRRDTGGVSVTQHLLSVALHCASTRRLYPPRADAEGFTRRVYTSKPLEGPWRTTGIARHSGRFPSTASTAHNIYHLLHLAFHCATVRCSGRRP